MIGWKIKIFGTNTPNHTGGFPLTDYYEVHVLGLDYTPKFIKAGARGEHGGYRSPVGKEKTMKLNVYPIDFEGYKLKLDEIYDILGKQYVYFNRGDYPEPIPDSNANSIVRIVTTGDSIEHDYNNGNKSIDIEVAIYE